MRGRDTLEAGEVSKGHVPQSLVRHKEGTGFYSGWDGKPLGLETRDSI